jgi:hypothetical protein
VAEGNRTTLAVAVAGIAATVTSTRSTLWRASACRTSPPASEREYLNDGSDREHEAILLRAELYIVAGLE